MTTMPPWDETSALRVSAIVSCLPSSNGVQLGVEGASRSERRGGKGSERSNNGARGRQGQGKERAWSARVLRHRQGGVSGAMSVR